MGRPRRSTQQFGWHHVMNRGVARQEVFFDDGDRVEFGRLLGVASERFGLEIFAYCLMPNHFHLVMGCPDGGLSKSVQLLASVFTRHVNDRVGRDGPLFRGRFRSRPIDDLEYLRTAVRYVHRNPLALPGVERPEQYRWSSHRAYLDLRRSPSWLRTDTVLATFEDGRADFCRFVSDDDQTPAARVDGRRLEQAVWIAIEETAVDLDRAPQGLARTVLQIADDMINPGATTRAAQRARQHARAHPALVEAAERALRLAS